jgi:hypothetical protein
MYFFRTFKKSTAPYKVHNMGLRYIKCQKELYKQGKGYLYDLCARYIMQAVLRWRKHGSTVTTPTTKSTMRRTKNARKPFATLTNTAAYKQVSHPSTKYRYSICTTKYRYTYRVSQCLSPLQNWDPHPLFRKRVCPPSGIKGGWDTLACVWGGGGGVPIRTTGEKAFIFCDMYLPVVVFRSS